VSFLWLMSICFKDVGGWDGDGNVILAGLGLETRSEDLLSFERL
jgi:hypothetical protein